MAVRTKRARMLYKLVYLLGPENDEYRKGEGKKPYSFIEAVHQTLAMYGYPYWASHAKGKNAEVQLFEDYATLMSRISDDMFKFPEK